LLNKLFRQSQQLLNDPVLRTWLWGRAIGRYPAAPDFTPHRPDYLKALPDVVLRQPKPPHDFGVIPTGEPDDVLSLPLPGKTIDLQPHKNLTIFHDTYDDIETLLALHRFAWLPILDNTIKPHWVSALWQTWLKHFKEPDDSWAWHPYTAAERVINILDFARRSGLPGEQQETLNVLAQHGPAIAERLEYFGETNTSNHLSNNGRGLYRLGLALGLSDCIGRGADILLKEAARIFMPSGVLREGSSHYHLLLTRNYADAWLAAREHKRAEERPLRAILKRALSVIPHLSLPGRFPLVGDISPDCPPRFLSGFHGVDTGWLKQQTADSIHALNALITETEPALHEDIIGDGWLRFDNGPWSGLWYVSPDGWAPMPSHAHQDVGSFELHYKTDPVFIDLGRGAYGETGDAGYYRSGQVHNTILINHQDPYPPNKPYYSDAFRRSVCGEAPTVNMTDNRIELTHDGYSRRRGIKTVERSWEFNQHGFQLTDKITGSRHTNITRMLHTPLPVQQTESGVVLSGQSANYTVTADTPVTIKTITAWQEYGLGAPATSLIYESQNSLPCELKLNIKVQDKNV
jgi:hypothetical protein